MTETQPGSQRLGYARISTYGQTLDAQLEQLRADGCVKIFSEKVTGARADRRELLKLLKTITPGDLVTVTRLDRLARSTRDLLHILATITSSKAGFRSLGDTWAEGRERAKARGVEIARSYNVSHTTISRLAA